MRNLHVLLPGANGLTINFFKKYFQYFGKKFVEMINGESDLPENFNISIIKLIPKNNNKIKTINDLRPISLTNIEYRIYTKAITRRLREISNYIISDHQTCSIKNRRINDNLILMRDIILNAIEKGMNVLFYQWIKVKHLIDLVTGTYLSY